MLSLVFTLAFAANEETATIVEADLPPEETPVRFEIEKVAYYLPRSLLFGVGVSTPRHRYTLSDLSTGDVFDRSPMSVPFELGLSFQFGDSHWAFQTGMRYTGTKIENTEFTTRSVDIPLVFSVHSGRKVRFAFETGIECAIEASDFTSYIFYPQGHFGGRVYGFLDEEKLAQVGVHFGLSVSPFFASTQLSSNDYRLSLDWYAPNAFIGPYLGIALPKSKKRRSKENP